MFVTGPHLDEAVQFSPNLPHAWSKPAQDWWSHASTQDLVNTAAAFADNLPCLDEVAQHLAEVASDTGCVCLEGEPTNTSPARAEMHQRNTCRQTHWVKTEAAGDDFAESEGHPRT